MAVKFTNNAKTTLASSITDVATTATVTDGSVFPTLGAGEYFYCTFDDTTNNEIVKVTARSGNTLTIVRGVDNTTARAFSSGDAAELRATAGLLTDIQENIAAKSANQTVYNTTTASSATDYDIGIDPSVEANAMVFLNGVMQHHDTFSFSGSTLTFDTAPSDGMALEVIVDNLINLQSSNLTVDTFTAADVGGSPQTDFTLSDSPAAETNLIVFVDGVFQDQDAYTISSNVLTMTDGVVADRVVTVYVINPVNIGTPSDGTVTSAKLSGNITMPGSLTVTSYDVAFDSPTFVVDNANSRVGIGTAAPSTLLDIVGDVKMSAGLQVSGIDYPTSDGTNGQVLTTDGAGTLSFSTISGYTDSDVETYISGGTATPIFSNTEINGTIKLNGNYPTGTNNVALGDTALDDGSLSGSNNTAIGSAALTANTTGAQNTAMGRQAGQAITTSSHNTTIGYQSLANNTTGEDNTALGSQALVSLTTGAYNTAVGRSALFLDSTGGRNTALGWSALYSHTGGKATAVGYRALVASTSSVQSTAIGHEALSSVTTGNYNVGVGSAAGESITTGENNVAVGTFALQSNTTASNNTAVGYGALNLNTTGTQNNAFGSLSLASCTTGNYNCAFGQATLNSLTTGSSNVAIGDNAAQFGTTITNNIAIGQDAHRYGTGNNNTVIGKGALANNSNSSVQSVAVGATAGSALSSGNYTTLLGYGAGNNQTTGGQNVYVGYNARGNTSSSAVEITMGYNTVSAYNGYSVTLGSGAGSDRIYNRFDTNASWTRVSDVRYKEEIEDNTDCGLAFINDLRPVTFKWKAKADIDSDLPDYDAEATERHSDQKMYGLIAQEVKQALDAHNITDFGGWEESAQGMQAISQEMFIHPLIKAVQELTAKLEAAEARITELENN